MKSRRSRRFRETYAALPESVRLHALDAYGIFAADPFHPGLQFKLIDANDGVWSVRVGRSHRALAWRRGEDLVWFWIGTHAEYDQLLRRR